jgi:hypothetical protein
MQITVKDILKNKGMSGIQAPFTRVSVILELDYKNNYKVFNRELTLTLGSQSCNFGGKRFWIACPLCGKRRYSLHLRDIQQGFLCRECLEHRYVSKTVSSPFRLSNQYENLVKALDHRPGPKPKRYRKFVEYHETYYRYSMARLFFKMAKKKEKEKSKKGN